MVRNMGCSTRRWRAVSQERNIQQHRETALCAVSTATPRSRKPAVAKMVEQLGQCAQLLWKTGDGGFENLEALSPRLKT